MRAFAIVLAMAMATVQAEAPIHVTISGEVAHPAEVAFQGAPRLADAVKFAVVNRNAYILAAAWLRPSLQDEQTRLKAGLIYELGAINQKAGADENQSLATLARDMRAWIAAMPVTGRQIVRTLEPHTLQVSPSDNLPVKDGDRLVYPPHIQSIAVVGAVKQACSLPQVGLKDVRDYLSQCEPSPFADADIAYVIEPDGRVFEQGVALWNLSPAMPVAPGATLYVPFGRSATLHAADERFNREMANFIATQPLGGVGTNP